MYLTFNFQPHSLSSSTSTQPSWVLIPWYSFYGISTCVESLPQDTVSAILVSLIEQYFYAVMVIMMFQGRRAGCGGCVPRSRYAPAEEVLSFLLSTAVRHWALLMLRACISLVAFIVSNRVCSWLLSPLLSFAVQCPIFSLFVTTMNLMSLPHVVLFKFFLQCPHREQSHHVP